MSIPVPLIFPPGTRFFFLVGSMKSGTTWLTNLLDHHPDVCSKGEMHALELLDNPATVAPPTLESVSNHAAALHRWYEMPNSAWNKPFRERTPEARWQLNRDSVRFFFEWTMMRYLEGTGRPVPAVIGDKSPTHTPYLARKIKHYFGDYEPFVVHLVRDPRDVAVSRWFHFRRMQHEGHHEFVPPLRDEADRSACAQLIEDPDSVRASGVRILPPHFLDAVFREWTSVNESLAREGPEVFGSRYVRLRYEDLKRNFEGSLASLFVRLGVDASTERLAEVRERDRTARKPAVFRKGTVGQWRDWFGPADVEIFDSTAREAAGPFGYTEVEPATA